MFRLMDRALQVQVFRVLSTPSCAHKSCGFMDPADERVLEEIALNLA